MCLLEDALTLLHVLFELAHVSTHLILESLSVDLQFALVLLQLRDEVPVYEGTRYKRAQHYEECQDGYVHVAHIGRD